MHLSSYNSQISMAEVLHALDANLPNLEHYVDCQPFLLQTLVGEEFWQSLSMGQRRSLGHQFKLAAMYCDLPVSWCGSTSNGRLIYVRN